MPKQQMPDAPKRAFAGDNAAGAHPSVIEAIIRANQGHALAYGADNETRACERRFCELFDRDITTQLVFNGTGANVAALATILRPAEAVICSDWAHISTDETGAPERIIGAKLIDLPTVDGKLTPAHVESQRHLIGDQHHAQPGVVSITQSTELGTVYSPSEVAAICGTAHQYGMQVHMDGARISNAVAAYGGTVEVLRAMTVDAGVDVLTFGGTKNGILGGEAVVFLTGGERSAFVRKMVTQLPSKMRFIAAQFNALLADDLWITLASHANAMSQTLYESTKSLPGIVYDRAPQVNSMFPIMPVDAIEPLREWCFFFDWDKSRDQVRWMTSWDTSISDVETFATGVATLLA